MKKNIFTGRLCFFEEIDAADAIEVTEKDAVAVIETDASDVADANDAADPSDAKEVADAMEAVLPPRRPLRVLVEETLTVELEFSVGKFEFEAEPFLAPRLPRPRPRPPRPRLTVESQPFELSSAHKSISTGCLVRRRRFPFRPEIN